MKDSAYEGSTEIRGRFAEAVIEMCAIFGKDTAQYDTIIDGYWNALSTLIPIDEFEGMCKRMIAEMYKMPTPRHFIGLKNKEVIPNDQAVGPDGKTKDEIEEERRYARGKELVNEMDESKREVLERDAKHLVEATLGTLSVGSVLFSSLVNTKMYEIAVTRAERRR